MGGLEIAWVPGVSFRPKGAEGRLAHRQRNACRVHRYVVPKVKVGAEENRVKDGVERSEDPPEDPKPEETKPGMAVLEMYKWRVEVPGRLLLISVPILWGSFGPAVRFLYGIEHAPRPSLFNAERLSLSALVYTFVLVQDLLKDRKPAAEAADSEGAVADGSTEEQASWLDENRAWIIGGLELGTYVFLANVAQVLGLQSVGAGRAAFLNQMQTVIVPIAGLALGIEKKLSFRTLASSFIAVFGVAILAADNNPEVVSSLKGDILELTSALFFSLYILRLTSYSKRTKLPRLVGGKVIVQAALAWVWTFQSFATLQTTIHFYPDGGLHDLLAWAAVIAWTGLMSSALSGWLQTAAQKVVRPSDAAVIFASQPLVAAALSWILLGENLDLQAGIGGLFIVGAAVWSSAGSASEEGEKTEAKAK
uniref:EamA domain-containing protein n=1 Tax=Rhodosorus marinus TaxID=101924 RepID=A0A7S2ZDY3_9RHOD|mmetsp:Transcript_13396/g.53695  ORF Transcript_13396/g.53695 Transcript_13396/m.53695 type:complete len:422 (+) Transcript_13396:394-1659(+)|eukprot:CAMPEP_0113967998 /NCGR_PEP_ID=MMETSP0011_2-20120614/9257_1 /TAXON_ID=101924 /ORGANISM="Rhodosorus marinus" /LENGTH=421 /DNA_ID=CAMNT_0000980975 /DNA_START=257 /DNA_END=1522 /DNA_ORIENTATION=- /assembly_acc=CAM_ASM_000156